MNEYFSNWHQLLVPVVDFFFYQGYSSHMNNYYALMTLTCDRTRRISKLRFGLCTIYKGAKSASIVINCYSSGDLVESVGSVYLILLFLSHTAVKWFC
jgi:hypothetical protein